MSAKEAGMRLKAVRKDVLGISNGETLAKELGVPRGTYVHLELGSKDMSTDFLVSLYNKYGVLPNYILLGKLPIKEGPEDKKNLVTDIAKMKAELAVLVAKVEFLSRNK